MLAAPSRQPLPPSHHHSATFVLGEGDTYFVDQYNQEFSRDMEPMKNGHGDNYDYLLVATIRRYKAVRPPTVPVIKPITIDGAFSD